MSAERPTCGNCPYYSKETCRRNTPIPANDSDRAVWPKVELDDYCGFHPVIMRQEKAIVEGGQMDKAQAMLDDLLTRIGR